MWYWFYCPDCKWRDIRYANVKTCPKCSSRCLLRGNQATDEEQYAKFNAEMKRLKEIPE